MTTIISRAVDFLQNAVQELDNSLREAPHFEDATERRVTQAICSMTVGNTLCEPSEFRYANAALRFFQQFQPAATTWLANGKDAVKFSWEDSDYQLLCGGGICYISRSLQPSGDKFAIEIGAGCTEQPEQSTKEDIGQFKDVAVEISQKLAKDIDQPKDVVPEVKDFSKEKGWVFCAGHLDSEFDCHSNKNIQDKMSKCVSLYDILLEGALYDGSDYHFDEMYYDYDKLEDFLLFGDSTEQATFCFKGDNKWPPSATQCLPLTYQPEPTAPNLVYWVGGPPVNGTNEVSISLTGGFDWPTRVFFQIPNICTATYEIPCADESVCGPF